MPTQTEYRESPRAAVEGSERPVVLVAEDDDVLRAYMVKVLMEVGYRVVEACNGKEAVSALRLQHVDLFITDLIMPEQEGLETILYARKHFPNLTLVAMSGALDTYLQAARCLGARAILHKPFSAGELVRTVECLYRYGWQPESGEPGTKTARQPNTSRAQTQHKEIV